MKDSQSLQPKQKKKIRKFKKNKQLSRPQQSPVRAVPVAPIVIQEQDTLWAKLKKAFSQPQKQKKGDERAIVIPAPIISPTPIPVLIIPVAKQKMSWRKHEDHLPYILIPLIFFLMLLFIILLNRQIEDRIAQQEIVSEENIVTMYPYPLVSQLMVPELSAKAAIVTDADSQVVLYSKNPQVRFSMASTTKIMTALTALDYFPLDTVMTVKSSGIEGSGLGLQIGEQFTFADLLYAMMLPSANDAAVTIADNYPGGQESFVEKMNEKAQSLHLADTHFIDPTGLEDDGDYTTVTDMARLASYAIKNKTLAGVIATKEKTISNLAGTIVYPLSNLNKLLGTSGVTGIKTGTTEGAGEVLVTSAVIKGHTYIIVVMNSLNRFQDTRALFSFIEDQVQYVDANSLTQPK